ncbi:MAG: isoprenylcysteine carboxylmethyltransferase family protein [Verrucomicrobiaceae bacterium]|nr:MAG: isoprenylcysteine carboxylmethyltransferase family protein [Verrucomicrobiaceae bacterium]
MTNSRSTLGEHRLMKANQSRGIEWVAMQFTLMALQFVAGITKRSQWPGRTSQAVGGALLLGAAAYMLSGARSLGRNLTPLPEPRAGGELVTTGIYARVRHPIYTSLIAGSFGWALLWRSGPALLLAAVQAVFINEKAKNEEERLRDCFPDYSAYARRVPRFLPHFRSGRK